MQLFTSITGIRFHHQMVCGQLLKNYTEIFVYVSVLATTGGYPKDQRNSISLQAM